MPTSYAAADVGSTQGGFKRSLGPCYIKKNLSNNNYMSLVEIWPTGFSSQIGTKLRDWAVRQAWGSCYSQAA